MTPARGNVGSSFTPLLWQQTAPRLVYVGLLIASLGCDGGPDESVMVEGESAPFSVQVHDTLELKDTEEMPLDPPSSIARVGDRFIVAGTYAEHVLTMYSATGAPLRRIDAEGPGPGEFRLIASVTPDEDGNVVVSDAMNQRRVVMSENLEIVGTARLEFIPTHLGHEVVTADREVYRVRRTRRDGGPLFRIQDEDGKLITQFFDGWENTPGGHVVFMAAGEDSTIWTAQRASHRITQWTLDGEILMDVRDIPTWFQPLEKEVHGPVDERRPPEELPAGVRDVLPDRSHVWILNKIPDPEATEELRTDPQSRRYARLFDTLIEVREKETWDLVALHRLDEFGQVLLPGPAVQTYRTGEAGNPIVELRYMRIIQEDDGREVDIRRR